jgi:raffinose/stachyose/melibiose transport system permease protein
MRKEKITPAYVISYVVLIFWSLTTIYPIIWILQNSFKTKDRILDNSFAPPIGDLFTTANYRKAFGNLNIGQAYLNSIFISGCVTIFVVLFAGMAAFAFARYKGRLMSFLYSMTIGAMMFPVFATIIPVFRLETMLHMTNTDSWFMTMLSVILPQIAGNLSFAIVVLTGYIKGLPVELEESAYLEGCSPLGIFFKIVVPLTKPSFATVAIFSFLWSYNDLFTQMFFLRRPEMRAITRLLNELTSREGTDYGLMAAAVALVVVPVIIVYAAMQKYIIKGMTAGAVKG